MKRQYAYFHAEGRSLQAIEGLEALRHAWQEATGDLRQKYGAQKLSFFEYPRTGKIEFWFPTGQQPQGWEKVYYSDGVDTITDHSAAVILCRPPEGSEAAREVQQRLGDVFGKVNPARTDMLGKLLGAPEMPMKKDSGGRHEETFVFVETADRKPGHWVRNAICHAQLNGHWYIRVPCDENNAPRFTPPDSPERGYDKMLSVDRLARGAGRRALKPVPGFKI